MARTSSLIAAFTLIAGAFLTSAASAAPVSWLLQGTITNVSGTSVLPGSPTITVGDPFSVTLIFDQATPVSNPSACGSGGAGTICEHFGSPLQQYVGLMVGTYASDLKADPSDNNRILLRNNVNFPTAGAPLSDTLAFSTTQAFPPQADAQLGMTWATVFLGTDLNLVTDGRMLPVLPPASWMSEGTRVFKVCVDELDNGLAFNCRITNVVGQLNSVSAVPEPGTGAMLALALGGLVLARRRPRREESVCEACVSV